MKCPGCGADVDEGADLCLECGEPMGDSPAAKVARDENLNRLPADPPAPAKPPTLPARPPTLPAKPPTLPARPPTLPAEPPTLPARPPTLPAEPPTLPARPPTLPAEPPTLPARPPAKTRRWAAEEPEPRRCPGCGMKSHAARCPNCGTPLKHDHD